MKRPLIGITCGLSSERCNDLSPNLPFYHVYSIYCEAIWNAGGRPVILPPVNPSEIEETADGLLEHLCRNSAVGSYEYQHRCHVRMDHS